jgi:hypothetical protein
VQTSFINQSYRWWKKEGRLLQIELAPTARLNVGVQPRIEKRGGQEILGLASHEIADRRMNVTQRKMNETVATQNQVGSRQRIRHDVTAQKRSAWPAVTLDVSSDQVGHHIDSDIGLDGIDYIDHPVEVPTTNVQEKANIELLHQGDEISAKSRSALTGGARPGDGFIIRPDPTPINIGEDRSMWVRPRAKTGTKMIDRCSQLHPDRQSTFCRHRARVLIVSYSL